MSQLQSAETKKKIGPKEQAQKNRCTHIIKSLQSHDSALTLKKLSTMSFGKELKKQWSHSESRFLKTDVVIPPKDFALFKDIQSLTSTLKTDQTSNKMLARYSPKCHYQLHESLLEFSQLLYTPLTHTQQEQQQQQQQPESEIPLNQPITAPSIDSGARILFFWATWSLQSISLLEEFLATTKPNFFPNHTVFTIAVEHSIEDANESVHSINPAIIPVNQQYAITTEEPKIIFQCSTVPLVYVVDEQHTINFIGHPNLINRVVSNQNGQIVFASIDTRIRKPQHEDDSLEGQSISKETFKALTQFARGEFKQYISKHHWSLPCHFNLSLTKESVYESSQQSTENNGSESRSVIYARPVIEFDCLNRVEYASIQAILEEIFSRFPEDAFVVRGNVQDENQVEQEFESFCEYLSQSYSQNLQFCLSRITQFNCKTLKSTFQEEFKQSNHSCQLITQKDAKSFGFQVQSDLEEFKSSNCQQNLDKFASLFRKGITYSPLQDAEEFMSLGYFEQFPSTEEEGEEITQVSELIEILPTEVSEISQVENTSILNKSQLIYFWATWNEESLREMANIHVSLAAAITATQPKTQTVEGLKAQEGKRQVTATTVCMECDDVSIKGSLNALTSFSKHLLYSNRKQHYSSLVHDFSNIPYIIIINPLNQVLFSEPFQPLKLDKYISGLFSVSSEENVQTLSCEEVPKKVDQFPGFDKFLESNKQWLKQKAERVNEFTISYTKSSAVPKNSTSVDQFIDVLVSISGKQSEIEQVSDEVQKKFKEQYTSAFSKQKNIKCSIIEEHIIPKNESKEQPIFYDLNGKVVLEKQVTRDTKAWVLMIPVESKKEQVLINHELVNTMCSNREQHVCNMCQRSAKHLQSIFWMSLQADSGLVLCHDCLPNSETGPAQNLKSTSDQFMISI